MSRTSALNGQMTVLTKSQCEPSRGLNYWYFRIWWLTYPPQLNTLKVSRKANRTRRNVQSVEGSESDFIQDGHWFYGKSACIAAWYLKLRLPKAHYKPSSLASVPWNLRLSKDDHRKATEASR